MTHRITTKFVREGEFAAEVEVELIDAEGGWAPYLSVEEANKLDDVRESLRAGDLTRESKMARLFRLTLLDV